MANRRVIVKRRKAVRNIRKITRTMQLIATARFQTAYARATGGKPYSEKLAEMVADLARASEGLDHPLLCEPEAVGKSDLVVITSSRGMAGGYNAGVLRAAVDHLDAQAAAGVETRTAVARKKGIAYFRFLGRPLAEPLTAVGDMPRFEEVLPIAEGLMQRFIGGETQAAYVAYARFYSVSRQRPEVVRLLPLARESGAGEAAGRVVQYEFSPEPRQLLDELLPATVRLRLYQAFTDAAVCEQIARMVAMKQATGAAEDKIRQLSREYNRARQTAITMELLDIVGGAAALA
jgi:F-type H+-transporting ATPase subunit gamma